MNKKFMILSVILVVGLFVISGCGPVGRNIQKDSMEDIKFFDDGALEINGMIFISPTIPGSEIVPDCFHDSSACGCGSGWETCHGSCNSCYEPGQISKEEWIERFS